jgi:hypothetical protein
MPENSPVVNVHVNIDLPAAALQAVVANAKKKVGPDAQGRFRVDTADLLSDLITRFLQENGFEAFAKDMSNY